MIKNAKYAYLYPRCELNSNEIELLVKRAAFYCWKHLLLHNNIFFSLSIYKKNWQCTVVCIIEYFSISLHCLHHLLAAAPRYWYLHIFIRLSSVLLQEITCANVGTSRIWLAFCIYRCNCDTISTVSFKCKQGFNRKLSHNHSTDALFMCKMSRIKWII